MGIFFTNPAKVKRFEYKPLYFDKEQADKEKRKNIVLADYAKGKAGKRFGRKQDDFLDQRQKRLEKARKYIIIVAVLLLVLAFVYIARLTNLLTLIP